MATDSNDESPPNPWFSFILLVTREACPDQRAGSASTRRIDSRDGGIPVSVEAGLLALQSLLVIRRHHCTVV